jgi:hypothetical protein
MDCDPPRSHEVDRRDLVSGPRQPDLVHRLVLPAGGQRVENVAVRQWAAVRPTHPASNGHRQRAAVAAPRQAGGEPLVDVASAGVRDHEQRLVDSTPREVDGIRERVEVADKGAVRRCGDDEARVSRRGRSEALSPGAQTAENDDQRCNRVSEPARPVRGSPPHGCRFASLSRRRVGEHARDRRRASGHLELLEDVLEVRAHGVR